MGNGMNAVNIKLIQLVKKDLNDLASNGLTIEEGQ